jgi:competence ComEA-like helix-hairpin-helix protein
MSAPNEQPPGPTRSEAAVVALMLAAVVAPMLLQSVVFRRAPNPPIVERSEERRLDFRIDVNSCNRLELEHLPGIGPTLAERIIASRESDGPFADQRDLLRVKGIGPKLLAKMSPYLAFPKEQEETTMAPARE